MRTLVTGGVRSGKSRHAEALLGPGPATYVAPGPSPEDDGDPDWVARIAVHRARRPASWRTVESGHLAAALREADGPVLIDCLGTWLTAVLDEAGWDSASVVLTATVEQQLAEVAESVRAHAHDVVLVTNEVGLGVVPEHRSGRLFRDLLGTANQRLAQVCDEVHLVVAGRVLRL
ncbi:MAG: adenosylcobinamide kinase/adenosylcobinamide phosphate guanyltransferase [Actinobacteria bacterium]|uniref:Adenosylcobinamide kinase n=1 Tax=freshwater metagenome TaxID=449393 RepID=A0A6J6QVG1_9ZZZZ|nr:adenosylcobinamide kinase/adenosylcobinamide phosphate guanyltransferase [Actinomycetota bacterium]